MIGICYIFLVFCFTYDRCREVTDRHSGCNIKFRKVAKTYVLAFKREMWDIISRSRVKLTWILFSFFQKSQMTAILFERRAFRIFFVSIFLAFESNHRVRHYLFTTRTILVFYSPHFCFIRDKSSTRKGQKGW